MNTILLVEDNPDDEALTVRALKKNNIVNEILVMRDGQQVLDYFADTTKPLPNLMLLDLKLPKVDGLDVLRRLRASQRTSLMPIVILTSSAEERDLIEGYKLGANSYVRKPVDFAQFADAANQLGMYWLVLNQIPKAQ